MLGDGGFRGALRRELDAIPLPLEATWAPTAEQERDWGKLFMAGAAAAGVVLAFVVVGVQFRAPERSGVLASPPVRPTTAPDGRRIAPLPNAVRNLKYDYNLLVPAWFRRSDLPIDAESNVGLLYREIWTARDGQSSVPVTATTLPPWDLVVEVWRRGDRGLEELMPSVGCVASQPEAACTQTTTKLRFRGRETFPAVLATIAAPVPAKVYIVERGDQFIVLRYAIGAESERPADVDEGTLEEIVNSLGLP